MDSKEAREILKAYKQRLTESASNVLDGDIEALDLAIKALDQTPCTDAISRSEAIRIASGYCHWTNIPDELAKLPSVNPIPCEDAISRQEVLDCLTATKLKKFDFILQAREEIKNLPSVSTDKTGRWKRRIVDSGYNADWSCSRCGYKVKTDFVNFNYCPNCGSRMMEAEE